jgi:hypothetical protein
MWLVKKFKNDKIVSKKINVQKKNIEICFKSIEL